MCYQGRYKNGSKAYTTNPSLHVDLLRAAMQKEGLGLIAFGVFELVLWQCVAMAKVEGANGCEGREEEHEGEGMCQKNESVTDQNAAVVASVGPCEAIYCLSFWCRSST